MTYEPLAEIFWETDEFGNRGQKVYRRDSGGIPTKPEGMISLIEDCLKEIEHFRVLSEDWKARSEEWKRLAQQPNASQAAISSEEK